MGTHIYTNTLVATIVQSRSRSQQCRPPFGVPVVDRRDRGSELPLSSVSGKGVVWLTSEARTAVNSVGYSPSSGHSAAPMHRQAQKDAGPRQKAGVLLSWRVGSNRRGCRIGSGLPRGELSRRPTRSKSRRRRPRWRQSHRPQHVDQILGRPI